MTTNTKGTTMEPIEKSFLLRMPAELADRFDQVVAAKYTTRSALVRELMAREVDAFFAGKLPVLPPYQESNHANN